MYFEGASLFYSLSIDGDPMSDDERYEPVPLGFGIEAAPPSYRAAISKKNEAIFKVLGHMTL